MTLENSVRKKPPEGELRYLTPPIIPTKPKKRHCFFTEVNKKRKKEAKEKGLTYHKFYIDYKDSKLLLTFISPTGTILPRRKTGVSAKYQKKLAEAIKRARHLALLPFQADGLK